MMFIAALFIIAKDEKLPRCPSAVEWVNKLGFSHTMAHCTVMSVNHLKPHATIHMNLTVNGEWKKPDSKEHI